MLMLVWRHKRDALFNISFGVISLPCHIRQKWLWCDSFDLNLASRSCWGWLGNVIYFFTKRASSYWYEDSHYKSERVVRSLFNKETSHYWYKDSHYKSERVARPLRFLMRIPMLIWRRLYIETTPSCLFVNKSLNIMYRVMTQPCNDFKPGHVYSTTFTHFDGYTWLPLKKTKQVSLISLVLFYRTSYGLK